LRRRGKRGGYKFRIQLLERRHKMEEKKLPVYESPKVVTYTDEELLE